MLSRLAVGGMAELFLVRNPREDSDEPFAVIKRLLPHLADQSEYIDMFLDEARFTGQLDHPGVAKIYDFGQCEGRYYIAMEFVDGLDVLTMLRECALLGRRLSPELAVYVAQQSLDALEHVHTRTDADGRPLQMIHRDVSPSNLLVSQTGAVKLVDFGIARATQRRHRTRAGLLKGKIGYMSPEQVSRLDVDSRSDLFSAAVVLAEMLMGRRLFVAPNELDALLMVRYARIERLDRFGQHIDPELDGILRRALSADPDTRYLSAAEFRDALSAWLLDHRRAQRAAESAPSPSRGREGETLPEALCTLAGSVGALVRKLYPRVWRRNQEALAAGAQEQMGAGPAPEISVVPAEADASTAEAAGRAEADANAAVAASVGASARADIDAGAESTARSAAPASAPADARPAFTEARTVAEPPPRFSMYNLRASADDVEIDDDFGRSDERDSTEELSFEDIELAEELHTGQHTSANAGPGTDQHADPGTGQHAGPPVADSADGRAASPESNAPVEPASSTRETIRGLPLALLMESMAAPPRERSPRKAADDDEFDTERQSSPALANPALASPAPASPVLGAGVPLPGVGDALEPNRFAQVDEFASRGTLSEDSPLSVLSTLARRRASGEFAVRVGEIQKTIYLREGSVCHVRSNLFSEHFGEHLVRQGCVSPGELSMALALVSQYEDSLHEALLQLQLVDEDELLAQRIELVRNQVIDVCSWKRGGFEWSPQPTQQRRADEHWPADATPGVSVPLTHILSVGALAVPDDIVHAWLARQGELGRRRPRVLDDAGANGLALGPWADDLCAHLDGQTSLDTLRAQFAASGREGLMWRVLHLLAQARLVDLPR